MVNVNNNFNVIPWYSSLEQQNHRKWYAFDKQWPLIMPNTRFLPFQFVLETTPTNISAITVYSEDKSITRNLGIAPIAVPNAEKGYCVVMLHPEICDFTAALPEGRYYATLTIDKETLYSEVFTVVGNISSYLKLTYWNTDTLYYKNGEINYANDFRYEMYLDTTIGKPEYEFSEELTTRLGYKFLESQISNKLYKFVFLGPEFICDAMRLIRLSDYIKLESGRDSYNAISFSYEPSWETQGDLASIEVSFETDTIIQKLPSFNRNQRENFYNALLSSASEPLLYDEGVVAQYYTAFSDAITGKLTRQLAEANVEEITKSTMIPIDQGLGAAQRVSLLALFERYGGKENAYVSALQTTVSNHVSNQDIHLAAGEREKLTTLLSFFRFDKTNNAVVTPFNFIAEGTIGMGDLGDGGNTPGATPSIGIQIGDSEPVYPNANGLITLPPYPEVGLDESALEQYLKTNQYAKKSDIPSLAGYAKLTDIPSLAGYATEQWVKQQGYLTQHQDLSAYAKSADVASTYATKAALQALQNEHNALSTKVTSLDNLLNSDVGGVINTWSEVVNFLDEYSGSQDLATILAGMNTDIANRVLYTDFEKLEDSVSGIAGYFTNGSANNALKLGGQLPSYYATADALNLVKKDVTAVSNRVQKFEDVIGIDANGDIYIKGTRNFYTEGGTIGMAGLGSGGGTGGGGTAGLGAVTVRVNGQDYVTNASGIVTIPDYPTSLPASDVYAWAKAATKPTYTASEVGALPLSGVVSQLDYTSSNPLLVNTTASSNMLTLKIGGVSYTQVGYYNGLGSILYSAIADKYLGIKDDGTPTYNGNTLLHSGNYSSYALPLSGGTISGSGSTILTVNRTGGTPYVCFNKDGSLLGFLGIHTEGYPVFVDSGGASFQMLHSANYSAYALPLSGGDVTGDIKTTARIKLYGTLLELDNADKTAGVFLGLGTIVGTGKRNLAIYNGTSWCDVLHENNIGSYNAGSATKLQTARTIWGQSFDGTANVSGVLTLPANHQIQWVNSNSMIYGNGSNITISNTGNLTIATSGNVLIGTTTDSGDKLQVNGAIEADCIYNNDNATGCFFGLRKTGLGVTDGGALVYAYGATPISFYTNATERMRILDNGYILVGTTADIGYKLQVQGSIAILSTIATPTTSNKLRFIRGTNSDDYWDYGLYAQSTKGLTFFQSNKGVDTDIAYLTGNGDLVVTGTIAMAKLASSSDRKLKDNITLVSAEQSMSIVRQLKPTTWNWKKDGKKSYGLIAQEVAPIVPEMVVDMGHLHLEYNQLHAFEIGAIKHIDSEVETLKRRVNELENELKQYRRNA